MSLTQVEKNRRYKERNPERFAEKQKKWSSAYYQKHRERILERVKAWAIANPAKTLAAHRKWNNNNKTKIYERSLKYRANNQEKYLFSLAKSRARRYNRSFTIELSDVVIPEVCPLLGVPINAKSTSVDYRPSIDRIDSSKGYDKGNILIISHRANRIKSDANGDELLMLALNLLRINGRLP